jgi:HK97 family phage prohead protease
LFVSAGRDDMEIKVTPTYTKGIDGRTVTGFASIFGNVDSYGDIVDKGAFRKTIKENGRRVKHLWMHDQWEPPTAAIKEMRETGRDELPDVVQDNYPEATGGLLVTREYLDTPRGNEILEGIKAGAISEMSFGFDTVKQKVEKLEVGDDDTSDVNFGANSATVAMKMLAKFTRPPASFVVLLELIQELKSGSHIDEWLAENPHVSPEPIHQALDTLGNLPVEAEPPTEVDNTELQKALTLDLLARLAIAEREYPIFSGPTL